MHCLAKDQIHLLVLDRLNRGVKDINLALIPRLMEEESTMLERPVATGQLRPVWLGTRHMQHAAVHLNTEKQEREQREW